MKVKKGDLVQMRSGLRFLAAGDSANVQVEPNNTPIPGWGMVYGFYDVDGVFHSLLLGGEKIVASDQSGLVSRIDPSWDSLSISFGRGADPREAAYLKKTYTVFLGASGNFDYWGDPKSGSTISVGATQGSRSTNFGPREHYQKWGGENRTEAGREW